MVHGQSKALAYVKPKERVVLTEDGMELLIRRYGDSLLRLCTLYLRDPYLAEDAVQDTYLKVWRHYQKFEGRASEKTWITRIAINTCKSYLASAWRKRVEMTEITQVLEEGLQNSSGNRDTSGGSRNGNGNRSKSRSRSGNGSKSRNRGRRGNGSKSGN